MQSPLRRSGTLVAVPAVLPVLATDLRYIPINRNFGATEIGAVPTVMLVGVLVLYLWGVRHFNANHDERWSGWRTAAFVAGLAVTAVAIESFIGAYDDVVFFDHMIQHLMLVMVAGPLLALGAPLDLADRGTTGGVHQAVRSVLGSRVAEFIGHPIVAFLLYAILIPVTHLTNLYNLTLTNDLMHDTEHLAFVVVGYLFWRPVVGIEPSRHPLIIPMRLVYLFFAVPIDTFTGVALVSTGHELFPYYLTFHRGWGPSLVDDLHIGGTIMWVFGDSLMGLAMVPVVMQWFRDEDRRTAVLDAELDAELARQAAADAHQGGPPGTGGGRPDGQARVPPDARPGPASNAS